MKPTPPRPLVDRAVVRCHVVGHAACRFPYAQLPSLRQQPGPLRGQPLLPAFLKNTDEQTVAGVAAVSRAMQGHGLTHLDCHDWGVIAAPRFLGRAMMATTLVRYAAEGAWGISPHLIPHRSLHSLSGTISQALKIHGPNYGVGGGPDGADEAVLVAAALLADGQLPGAWLVLTGFDPELMPPNPVGENNQPPATDCLAVALALRPSNSIDGGTHLTVGAGDSKNGSPFSLEALARTVSDNEQAAQWTLRCGGWVAWDLAAAAVETCL